MVAAPPRLRASWRTTGGPAHLLAKAGKRVIILERGGCAATDTGHTSAYLTMVTDARLGDLVKGCGRTHAQAVWDAGLAAIATIDDIARRHGDASTPAGIMISDAVLGRSIIERRGAKVAAAPRPGGRTAPAQQGTVPVRRLLS